MEKTDQPKNPDEIHFFLDKNGVILDIDESIEKLTGYKKEEIVGQNFRLFIHPQDLPGLFISFQKVLEDILEPYEYRITTKSGDYTRVRSSSHPTKENGVTVGIEGILVKV